MAIHTAASVDSLKTPLELFYQWESQLADKAYLHQPINGEWHVWTWREFGQEVRRMAAAIEARNFAPGTRIGILSRNCAHWMMADIAIAMSGHTSVPIYPNVNAETVQYVLTHSEAEMCFVGKLEPHDWKEMRTGIPASVECISFGMYGLDADYVTWQDETAKFEPKSDSPGRSLEDIWTIIYTSGTTGTPKGVVHKMIAPVFAFETFQKIFNLTPEDRFFSYLPMSHIAERMLITTGTLRCGGSVHFAQSLDTFRDNLVECKPTVFLGVPRIWTKFQMGILAKFSQARLNLLLSIPFLNNVIRKKIREALGLDHARICLTGAAPTPVSLQQWYKRIGIIINEVYGMTENSAYSHSNLPDAYKFGHAGKTMPGVEMKITDEGEICVKSLSNMVEYYKEPEKTADALRDGWLHTGDCGEMTPDGFLKITGRVKDLFKTSKAKYVAPNPIELKFAKNSLIEQICVVGTGIPQPIALVVLSENAQSQSPDDIKASLDETLKEVNPTLEHHEQLQKVVVVKETWDVENGMMTPSLKIKRNAVDGKYAGCYEEWYAGGKGVVFEN
ncbi:MAG: AMP-binding protein [Bacteroidota bacterium]